MIKLKKILALSMCLSLVGGNIGIAQQAGYGYSDQVTLPSPNMSNVIQADIKSERIPAGTALRLRMDTPVNSNNHTIGSSFRANLTEDVRIGRKTVLPTGTPVTGRVKSVSKGKCFTRGGKLSLNFYDVVTPMGKQIPLNVKIVNAENLTPEGNFFTGETYFKAVGKGLDKGSNFLIASTEYSIEKGKSFWKGYPVLLTVPLGTFVGLAGAGGIFAYKSIYAMFDKGENIKIEPGDIINVILLEPLDVPIY